MLNLKSRSGRITDTLVSILLLILWSRVGGEILLFLFKLIFKVEIPEGGGFFATLIATIVAAPIVIFIIAILPNSSDETTSKLETPIKSESDWNSDFSSKEEPEEEDSGIGVLGWIALAMLDAQERREAEERRREEEERFSAARENFRGFSFLSHGYEDDEEDED